MPPPATDGGSGARQDDLETLRRLLTGPEQDRLRTLEKQVDRFEVTADAVAIVLPEAIAGGGTDQRLTRALTPTIESAIAESVHRNPEPVAQAIYPTLGPAIRKAISEALAGFVETLNRAIDSGFSAQGLRWRLESWRTGVPYAQIVIRDSLAYQVEQVFLIHGETGLLLAHAVAGDTHGADGDLVSGMLTAIRDFVADSFDAAGEGGLSRFTVGERVVLVETGPQMLVAAVVHGQSPTSLLGRLQETLEMLHTQHRQHLQGFEGDNAPFTSAVPILEECLDTVLRTEQSASRRRAPRVVWALVGLAVAVLAVLSYRSTARWDRATTLLGAEPGIVLLEANRGWRRSTVSGLRDPLAAEPATVLADTGVDLARLDERWRPYLSLEPVIVERRGRRLLRPPATVTVAIADGALQAHGTASPAWLAHATATTVPGVDAVDVSGVEMVRSARLEQSVARIEQLRVLFPVASATPDSAPARDTLRAVADIYRQLATLAETEGWRVELIMRGRTDPTGSRERNTLLSVRRSEAVRDVLDALGIPIDAVRVAGLGVSEPLPADDPENQSAINRSVSFTVSLTPDSGTGQ